MKFSIEDFFSKYLLKKMKNGKLIFCAMKTFQTFHEKYMEFSQKKV